MTNAYTDVTGLAIAQTTYLSIASIATLITISRATDDDRRSLQVNLCCVLVALTAVTTFLIAYSSSTPSPPQDPVMSLALFPTRVSVSMVALLDVVGAAGFVHISGLQWRNCFVGLFVYVP